jgi:hypothetical protein
MQCPISVRIPTTRIVLTGRPVPASPLPFLPEAVERCSQFSLELTERPSNDLIQKGLFLT